MTITGVWDLIQVLGLWLAACSLVVFADRRASGVVGEVVTVTAAEDIRFEPPLHKQASIFDNIQLMDKVILGSIDGRLHAVDRNTGNHLWSSPVDHPATQPLVRTDHHLGQDEDQELFIIEPQTGDIFVLPASSDRQEPLRRLPYSVPQLVELSPFSFTDPARTFVGRKETSIITINLLNGEITRTSALASKVAKRDQDILEEEDIKVKPAKLVEVQIGRTDYQVDVLTKSSIVQTLSFSVYGPNNVDRDKQVLWDHTPDDVYVQALWDGKTYAFEPSGETALWMVPLPQPVVAVFDVLGANTSAHPLVLLQPRPRLQDLFPTRHAQLNGIRDRTVVGQIGDSLFAMSNINYPLVNIAQVPEPPLAIEGAEAPDLPVKCTTLWCYLGARYTERDDAQSRLSRLLESPKAPLLGPHSTGPLQATPMSTSTWSALPPASPSPTRQLAKSSTSAAIRVMATPDIADKPQSTALSWTLLIPFAAGFLAIWFLLRRLIRLGDPRSPSERLSSPSRREYGRLQDPEEETPLYAGPSNARNRVRSPSRRPSNENPVMSEKVFTPSARHPPTILEVLQSPILPPHSPATPIPIASNSAAPVDEDSGREEEDGAGEEGSGGKKKRPRRRRQKKKGASTAQDALEGTPDDATEESNDVAKLPSLLAQNPVHMQSVPAQSSPATLVVTSKILGYGSHGTVVYEGSLQGRAVAVKRLLQDFVTVASREVAILQESDDHPNVIRYFYQERKDTFLYIALELCPASLADVVERPHHFQEIVGVFDPKKALEQITRGLKHLHGLKIIHRDIKPQNILVSKAGKNGLHRMLISDFGLCKKLEMDQTSFIPTMAVGGSGGLLAAGTVGWRAPEILRGEVKLDEAALSENGGSNPGTNPSIGPNGNGKMGSTRLTKSVDIFALGCLYYYVLSSGDHPFGDKFSREANILKDAACLTGLEGLGEEGAEAIDLIARMLAPEPSHRPDTSRVLVHPFFWTPNKRLMFLQDASDRFEIMERDPREPGLIALERGAHSVVGADWHRRLDKVFIDNLGKFRKYDGSSVQDLMRALRNKKHHYQDLPDNVKRTLGSLPDGYLAYFTRRFPALFLHVHGVVDSLPLRHESMFRSYFTLDDH